jgi:hypothetical protein
VAAAAAAASAGLALPGAAHAAGLALRAEPANALSLPTWAIHVSSVTEWVAAMALMWRYGEVSGNARWKGMTWGMMPALGSAMAACTWHFFYNSPGVCVSSGARVVVRWWRWRWRGCCVGGGAGTQAHPVSRRQCRRCALRVRVALLRLLALLHVPPPPTLAAPCIHHTRQTWTFWWRCRPS